MGPWHVLGLDVGPPGEPTGFAILESPALDQAPIEYEYHLRHVERFPPGTSYPAIINMVAERVKSAGLKSSPIAVDLTAVGRQFLEQCWKAQAGLYVRAICVTAGLSIQKTDDGTDLVPKRDLVVALQLALQSRRLKIAPELPQADLLTTELAAFRLRKVSLGELSMVEWREGHHDDLVFAVALAVWYAQKHPPFWPGSIAVGGGPRFFKRTSFRPQIQNLLRDRPPPPSPRHF